jgi:glutamine synthetase type III
MSYVKSLLFDTKQRHSSGTNSVIVLGSTKVRNMYIHSGYRAQTNPCKYSNGTFEFHQRGSRIANGMVNWQFLSE